MLFVNKFLYLFVIVLVGDMACWARCGALHYNNKITGAFNTPSTLHTRFILPSVRNYRFAFLLLPRVISPDILYFDLTARFFHLRIHSAMKPELAVETPPSIHGGTVKVCKVSFFTARNYVTFHFSCFPSRILVDLPYHGPL